MPRYAPLPNIELDPRIEAELVQQAAQRVYEASGATLNDFSSGSPIMALLEGQAFAQSEFLQFANQFPESVLVEWIGPFLGAQRRTGAGAVVQLTITIDPRPEQYDVFEGYQVATDPALTNGQSIGFVTTERLIIPPGQTTGEVNAISVFRGVDANVPPGSITRSVTSLAGITSVTNLTAAAGGQDAELLAEVKERFFSLIRRRNPVSAEDWVDFFSDALGAGTSVTVLPRRSERDVYLYDSNYVRSNPSVAFFVLNPDGTPITPAQRGALQNLLKWSLPVEFLGYVYPMEVDDVDIVIDLKYDPTKPYGQDLPALSQTVRNNLFAILQPNAVFPNDYEPSVTDIEGALTQSFPVTLGVTNQYTDPDIAKVRAYSVPKQIADSQFTDLTPRVFDTGFAIQQNDLVSEQTPTETLYYPALRSFNPVTNTKSYHVNTGDLDVELIQELTAGDYKTGDVISLNGDLVVVLADFTYTPNLTVENLRDARYISESKTFTPWGGPGTIYNPLNADGNYDPQIIAYEDSDTDFVVAWPKLPAAVDKNRRPGAPIYVVNRLFTVNENTTTLGNVQNDGSVATLPVPVRVLENGRSYSAGEYVRTTGVAELNSAQINQFNCYLDPMSGVKVVYGKALKDFTFTIDGTRSYRRVVDDLVETDFIETVSVVPFVDCQGEPLFSETPFRYTARFFAGEYIRYRPQGGFDANELERCVRQNESCPNVSGSCKRLLAKKLPTPRYFFALKDFTPNTSDVEKMVEEELISEVSASLFTYDYVVTMDKDTYPVLYSADITTSLVNSGQISSNLDLTNGQTVLVVDELNESRGLYEYLNGVWTLSTATAASYRDMFRFAPGDVASFRNVSEVRNYRATEHVTPIMRLEVYFDNGVFVRETEASETVKWFDPNYHLEDVIYNVNNAALYFYRAISSFTPPVQRTVWNGQVLESTPRIEEIFGNLLKFVVEAECDETVASRLRDNASTIKLGTCQTNLMSKAAGAAVDTFVWESSAFAGIDPPLSMTPGSTFPYGPVDYGTGTLAL